MKRIQVEVDADSDEHRRPARFRTAESRLAAVDAAAGIWSDRTDEDLDDVMRFRSRLGDRLPD